MEKRKTSLKPLALLIAFFFCLQLGTGVFLLRGVKDEPLDMVALNELLQSVSGQWEELKEGRELQLPASVSDWEFSLTDSGGSLLASTGEAAPRSVHEATARRDLVIDVPGDGTERAGRLLLVNELPKRTAAFRNKLLGVLLAVSLLELLAAAGYLCFLEKRILRPFEKLREFAVRVAGGDLDFPLEMDRGNVFGAFSESFDLLREELKQAREQERAAQQSKKELVAKLSHDIKTPVASIQAVSELMALSAATEKERGQLETIRGKARQIDSLITDLFQASLEELQQLPVKPSWYTGAGLAQLLTRADYRGLAQIEKIPPCMVRYDELRLQQVFDNLFGNAYKYAGGPMRVSFSFGGNCLRVLIEDEGPGAPEEELPFLLHKFYRGKNAEGKNGVGLGLFISAYLLEQMGGSLSCRNTGKGFLAAVSLAMEGL